MPLVVSQDEKLKSLPQELLRDPSSHPGYSLENGSLLYKGRLVHSKHSTFIPQFLREFHASPFKGHSGFFLTYKRISTVLLWEGLKNDVKNYFAGCEVCQRNKYQAMKPAKLLQSLPFQLKFGRIFHRFH